MFELVFHKKEIPQRAGVGPNRIEQDRSGGGSGHQKFPRGFGAGKIVPMFEELEDEHSGDDGEGDGNGQNSRIFRHLPFPLGTRGEIFAGKPFLDLGWNRNIADQSRNRAIETLLIGKFAGAASAEDRCTHGTVVHPFLANGRAVSKKTLPARQANDFHFASFCGTVVFSHA